MERRKSGLSEGEVEDCLAFNPEFRKSLEKARREIAEGKYTGIEELKRNEK